MTSHRWTIAAVGVFVVLLQGCIGCGEQAMVEGNSAGLSRADAPAGMWPEAELPVESDWRHVAGGERRGATFSILGAVTSPGLYESMRMDMRLLDAIALARGVTEPATYAYILRPADQPDQVVRVIAIDLHALFHGDPRMNILIQPDDTILIAGQVLDNI
jgi:hypothetical protein